MITMRDRVRRPIQANLKRFIFVVVVFSLALCLLGQIALSFYCFYDSHRGVMGDEASVFLDPSWRTGSGLVWLRWPRWW